MFHPCWYEVFALSRRLGRVALSDPSSPSHTQAKMENRNHMDPQY